VGTGATEGLPTDADRSVFNPTGRLATDLDDRYFPLRRSSLIGAANPRFGVPDDFGKTSRQTTRDVGAYAFRAGGNPGWTISPGFKTLPDPSK